MQTDSDRNLMAFKKLLLIQRHLNYINRFNYSVLESLAKNKNHFDLIKSFFTSEAIPNEKSYSLSNIKETDQLIPGLQALTEFLFFQKPQNFLIEYLTFSIIPSYFRFFLTNQSISQLSDFFLLIRNDPKYTDEHYDQLARVVFLTPNFLSFSELVFQPFFTLLYSNYKQNANKEETDKLLLSNFSKFKYLLPKETFVVLKLSTDIFRTLKNSFIKLALSSQKNSYLYNFFHLSQEPSEKILSILQSKIEFLINSFISIVIKNNPFFTDLNNQILSLINDFDNLNQLIIRINTTNIYNFPSTIPSINNHIPVETMTIDEIEREPHKFVKPKHFFSPVDLFENSDLDYFQEYFNPLFISSNDIQLFNFFNNELSSFQPSTEINLFFDFNGTLSNYNRIKLNMNNNLKKLLTKSNRIRLHFLRVTSLYDFLNSLYVNSSIQQGEEIIQSLLNMPVSMLMTEIDNSFHFLENAQIKHDFAIDHILPLLNHNAMLVEYQKTYFYNINDYFNLLPKKVKHLSLKKYIKHPDLFENDFQQLKRSYPKVNDTVILQKILKETKFSMSMYLKKRGNIKYQLDSYDEQMKIFFSDENNYISYIDNGFVNRSVIEFANLFPSNYYNNQIDLSDKPQIEIICNVIVEAFLEDSVLRKFRLLSLLYFMIINEFGQNNRNLILDADNATLISSLIFLKINPPKLMTNILFLEDSINNIEILFTFIMG